MGYLFEHEAQPDKFENIPQSIYWAVVTLASVGYGDISPITPQRWYLIRGNTQTWPPGSSKC